MLREAQSRHVNEIRSLYESMVAVFPTTARYWKIYIEQEIKARNYERVEKVQKKTLSFSILIFFAFFLAFSTVFG